MIEAVARYNSAPGVAIGVAESEARRLSNEVRSSESMS